MYDRFNTIKQEGECYANILSCDIIDMLFYIQLQCGDFPQILNGDRWRQNIVVN